MSVSRSISRKAKRERQTKFIQAQYVRAAHDPIGKLLKSVMNKRDTIRITNGG